MTERGAPPKGPADYHHQYHDETWHTPRGRVIRELVFGANDGLVTTIGFLAGVTGALADRRTILIATGAEIVAGTISMAAGAYISTKSQRDFFETEIAREKWEMEHMPEMEKQEIRDIYTDLGFEPDEVEMIVRRVTSDKDLWLRFMMREELGIIQEQFDDPIRSGALMGGAFIVGALPPLIPYLLIPTVGRAFGVAIIVALVTLFAIGVGRTRVTKGGWMKSGLEIMILGSLAALIGYGLGTLVSFF